MWEQLIDERMGLNVWTGCGTKVASEAGVNRFLRGIHQRLEQHGRNC